MKEKEILYTKDYDESELPEIAQALVEQFSKDYSVWIFRAPMGAGKTTLIKQLCAALGVHEEVASPTFAIINEYLSSQVGSIFHFDCYRLETLAEAYSIGVEEYLDGGNYCFIEWPEVLEDLLPSNTLEVSIEILSSTHRRLSLKEY